MIKDNLAGKTIALTGATGFLGTAVVERILRSVPGSTLVLIIRSGKMSTPEQRARREVFRNSVFKKLRSELGDDYEKMLDDRVRVIEGDVTLDGLGLGPDDEKVLATCDVVIHCAATVSFEAPIDQAVEVNLLGPVRLAETVSRLNSNAHLVAVSTCYVAGNRRGEANEELLSDTPFHIDVDWRDEVSAARRAKGDFDAISRSAEKLSEFQTAAQDELGAAGKPLLSAKTESLRQAWVVEQLAEAGRARAESLGWPDAYVYTKALGERALDETKGDLKVSIVRPSIIESAWSEPEPGWIKGFRMAEPLIINYARGVLKQFPGAPEGIIDVIPVDLVVAAIICVAAKTPADDTTEVFQVASGSTNPLHYRHLIDLVSSWFGENPLYDKDGEPIAVAPWAFWERSQVEQDLERSQRGLELIAKMLRLLPLRGKPAMLTTDVDEKVAEAQRARDYVKIYGAYAECEALYGVNNLLSLYSSLDQTDKETFCFDPSVIDWNKYVTEIHLPSIIKHARVKTTPEASTATDRNVRLRKQVLDRKRQLAAFDLEGTILASNVVYSYMWVANQHLDPKERIKSIAKTLSETPTLLTLDKQDRGDFLRYFYRRYSGVSVQEMEQLGPKMLADYILKRAFPDALGRIREHKRLGHRTLLITGEVNIVVEPLKPLFDDVICAEMSTNDGVYTGELLSVPPTSEVRAQALRDYATENGFDLAESVAYADSSSDLPLLDAVGYPVAVNPETRLASAARKRGWLTEYWARPKASDRFVRLASKRGSKSPKGNK